MLGNFSFGDYFKREAINFCWTFLTENLQLPKDRLWITVHHSDDEAAAIWIDEIGIDPNRLSRLDEDNFWQMGDTGPCGRAPRCSTTMVLTCQVALLDRLMTTSIDTSRSGISYLCNTTGMRAVNCTPLPAPSVDTGMGLERIAAVMQGVHNNYDIDLFANLVAAAADVLGVEDRQHTSLRVIADHLRSCAFLICDGVMPGNEGRGYVLRRIMRRAIRHGNKLGADAPFFHKLVATLSAEMGAAYPELNEKQSIIENALLAEEEQFARTLDKGMAILDEALADLEGTTIPGEVVFRLYDTYGFPVDLTNDIARERGLDLDVEGYEAAMQEQRKRSQESGAFKVDYNAVLNLEGETDFVGYAANDTDARVMAIYVDGEPVDELSVGQEGIAILDSTPFYGESGGQVGDTGLLTGDGLRVEVRDTTKSQGHHLHHIQVTEGTLSVGSRYSRQSITTCGSKFERITQLPT